MNDAAPEAATDRMYWTRCRRCRAAHRLECKLVSYDAESCRLVGEIVNVSVDERVLDADGHVDVSKAQPITFDPFNHAYVVLGEAVGRAFHDGLALK